MPDRLGAYDNSDNTFTVLTNHEWGAAVGAGILHSHGATGAYQSRWVIDKSSLLVLGGGDLITSVYGSRQALFRTGRAIGRGH
jgi:hypothetical protein